MNLLEEIIAHKHIEIDQRKRFISPRQLYALVAQQMDNLSHKPLKEEGLSFVLQHSATGIIAEFKRKSPAKGWINEAAKASDVCLAYEKSGATALSIVTDIDYFAGYDEFVQEARAVGVQLPILYNNFIVDDYQLLQARFCGASAIVLIAEVLSKDECKRMISLAHQLELEVMIELHEERSLDYLELEPDLCGVNNCDLRTFVSDVNTSLTLADRLPKEVCKVSENGISDVSTAALLRSAGYDGLLVSDVLMQQSAPGEALKQFIHELKKISI